jgi:hypothetical protein
MPNPYITDVDPYMSQQDLSGYAPTMQDIAQQKLMQQLALAQQNQQVSDAGQTGQQSGGMSGLNPLAMAMMLRKKKPDYDQYQTSGDMTYFGSNSKGMGAGGSADFNSLIGLT